VSDIVEISGFAGPKSIFLLLFAAVIPAVIHHAVYCASRAADNPASFARMRVGASVAFGIVLAAAVAGPANADAIVRIVNTSNSPVTVRIDGAFGCRAQSKAAAPPDMDMVNQCSFGTSTGNHTFEFHFDNGKDFVRSVTIPQTGYAVTLTGDE
jgi:hypothetical protein